MLSNSRSPDRKKQRQSNRPMPHRATAYWPGPWRCPVNTAAAYPLPPPTPPPPPLPPQRPAMILDMMSDIFSVSPKGIGCVQCVRERKAHFPQNISLNARAIQKHLKNHNFNATLPTCECYIQEIALKPYNQVWRS